MPTNAVCVLACVKFNIKCKSVEYDIKKMDSVHIIGARCSGFSFNNIGQYESHVCEILRIQ